MFKSGEEWICWSCRGRIDPVDGVSLHDTADDTGSDELHVCADCWKEIPASERIRLGFLFRSRDGGGSGIVDLIASFAELCKTGAESYPFGMPKRSRN